MGNSLKLTKWIGIGLAIMIIIALGMAVIKGFDSFMAEDSDKLEIVDTNEINNTFAPYKGKITGTKVRQLINKLIEVVESNPKNPEMLIDVAYQLAGGDDFIVINSTVDKTNEKEMKTVSMKFESTYSYNVEFLYSKKGVINGIIIKYDEKSNYTFEPDEN